MRARAVGVEHSTEVLTGIADDRIVERGQKADIIVLGRDGQHAAAARAYLESFSGTPEGPRAPEALVGLGTALGSLGQNDEACLTLSEVAIRFPNSPAISQANAARAGLGCAG